MKVAARRMEWILMCAPLNSRRQSADNFKLGRDTPGDKFDPCIRESLADLGLLDAVMRYSKSIFAI